MNTKTLAQIALVGFLIIGCFQVISPFLASVLFAFVLWLTTWPIYQQYILARIHRRKTLAALIATSFLLSVLIVPTFLLALTFAKSFDQLILFVQPYLEMDLPQSAPEWLANIPWIGNDLAQFWEQRTANREELRHEFNNLLRQGIAPARAFAIKSGTIVANGLLQLTLVFFILFFFYRDGEKIARYLETAAQKLGGNFGSAMLLRVYDTVNAVMLGIVGTAAAQAVIALIGFLISGTPAPVPLAFATFLLSMIPVGPPLVWGGAAAWLYFNEGTGWCIFMVLYGIFVISSVDNFLKPFLMARGAGLSLVVVALGIFGGILVFGFIGIFLGPVFLALGQMLFTYWIEKND